MYLISRFHFNLLLHAAHHRCRFTGRTFPVTEHNNTHYLYAITIAIAIAIAIAR
uniref:Uncharacterized protein n=1 Tax=Erwinia amylovora ATCC BAA-2158 TaxID=889211 RepID=E5B3I6_ERWAM|nr:hypothetical protein predicted by Glimmer/Critica [Erwinia amylovora ATCC BAA-2158]